VRLDSGTAQSVLIRTFSWSNDYFLEVLQRFNDHRHQQNEEERKINDRHGEKWFYWLLK
jgi:hypothetical protein